MYILTFSDLSAITAMSCKGETNNNNLMESVHSPPKFLRSSGMNYINGRRGSLDLTALSGQAVGSSDDSKTSLAAAAVSPRQRRYSQQHQRSSLASCLDK